MPSSEQIRERNEWRRKAEAEGRVADSLEVRMAIMKRFHDGEISLIEAQAEIAYIKRTAKKNGKITRNQAYLGR